MFFYCYFLYFVSFFFSLILRHTIFLMSFFLYFFFFFSSRRRHTRYWRDWSSDVCSSDLSRISRTPQRHAHLRGRSSRRTTPGAQSHPRRRNARSRNHRNRPRSFRNRPPRSLHAPHHRRRQNRRAHHWRLPDGRSARHAQPPREGLP